MLAGIDAIGGFVTGGGAAGSFAATANPTSVSKTLSTSGPSKTVRTQTVTVTAVGGLPGYTYAWTDLFGDGITADSASSATTSFSKTLGSGESATGTLRCTVTDSTISHAIADVDVTLTLVGP